MNSIYNSPNLSKISRRRKLLFSSWTAEVAYISFSNQVLVSIKNWTRRVDIRYGLAAPPYKQLFGFAKLWQLGENDFAFDQLYGSIITGLDYRVFRWDDSQYMIHLRPLVSEQEWMQFKKDILRIYAEQNAKRAALRKLIEFNPYRSMKHMNGTSFGHIFHNCCLPTLCHCDPLRDPCCPNCVFRVEFRICYYACIILYLCLALALCILCLAVDVLTYPRFFFFNGRRHRAFLEAVMRAHPDLDPVLVEEELVQKLRLLTDIMSRHHPGVRCRFTSILYRKNSKKGPVYSESFQIQFSKYF